MSFNYFPIRTKLILLLSLSAIFALTISFIASAYYMVQTQRERSLYNLTQIAKITGQNISASLVFDDEGSAQKMLQPLAINPSIIQAMVYTVENKLFAEYVNTSNIKQNITLDKEKFIAPNEVTHQVNWDMIGVTVPIVMATQKVGYIKIISDTQEFKDEIQNGLTRLFIVGFLIVLIIVFASFKLHKIFTSPIYKLLNIMQEVSSLERYDVQVDSNYKDEFQDLYLGFSLMLTTLKEQKEKIEFIHKQTRDSIEYSANIQASLLPRENEIVDFFNDSFTIWQPKDTVGGDIYLFETLRHKDEALLMVIDCTGHGVPGAFVTMIVKAIEKEIVAKLLKSDFDIDPAIIMAYFNKNMQLLLHHNNSVSASHAGFDGGIVYINKEKKILRYAGSNTPLFVLKGETLDVFKGDRESIGYKKSNPDYEFTKYEVALDTNTKVYLTTDGYLDQTGGEKGFLFGKKRFARLIESTHNKPYEEQKSIFEDTFKAYKKDNETKDDMTLIAFSI